MLIVSLPPVHQDNLLRQIITHSCVGAVRYNTGVNSAHDPKETVRRILQYSEPLNKPLFIDLKGKQLRIIEWAILPEGAIVLNHPVKVKRPAKIYLRGNESCDIVEIVDGNKIYVDPVGNNSKQLVGNGQSVNILSDKLEVDGGLLPLDHEYIEAGLYHGVTNFMLSFVETMSYVRELEIVIARCSQRLGCQLDMQICLKIESQAGLDFVKNTEAKKLSQYRLMAACDDLMIQIGVSKMMDALETIIEKDPNAIRASRLFMGLENGGISLADVSDIEYMQLMGYKDFMLSDGISREHFSEVSEFWQEYMMS